MWNVKNIGIDLGTTNSCVAIVEGGKNLKIIENQEEGENYSINSIVAISADGGRLVGLTAKLQSIANPDNTFFAVKRLIGRRFNDESVQREKSLVAFKVVELENGDAWLEAK
ncbi:Hsp70 family protein [Candidatus Hodgkinia cicadicola]